MVRRFLIGLRVLASAFALVMVTTPVAAQSTKEIPRGASVFVDEMENDLDGFIRAVIVDKKLPLRIVLRREEAHFVIAGESTATQKTSWHEGWLTTPKDKTEGNVMVFDRASKQLVFAAQAGDRSLFLGPMRKGGQRKVAERLVDKLQDNISKTQAALPPPPPLAPEEMPASSSPAASTSAPRLTNKNVIDLVTSGLSDDLIITKIRSSACEFDTTTEALVALKRAKVSDAVIAAMMK